MLDAAVAQARSRLAHDQGNFTALKSDYQSIADAYASFDSTLRGIAFPAPVDHQVGELLTADGNLELWTEAAASAASPASQADDEQKVATLATVQAGYARAVRSGLGLPAQT